MEIITGSQPQGKLKAYLLSALENNAGFILLFSLINAFSICTSYCLKEQYLFAYCYGSTIFLLTLLGSFLLGLVPVRWQGWTKKVILLITIIPWLVELFVMYSYQALIGAGVINAMLETNAKEALEFARMYVGVREVLLLAVILASLAASFRYCLWEKMRPEGLRARKVIGTLTVAGIIGFAVYPNSYEEMFSYEMIPLQRIVTGGSIAYDNMIAYRRLVDQLNNNIEITENKSEIANIVFILGESTNRNHMHHYGYYLDNTPQLDKLVTDGEAVSFNNIISPHSTTIAVLSKLFTFCHLESDKPWYEYNNLVDVMNKAGYKTFWLSNQESSGMWGNVAQIYAAHSSWRKFTRIRDSVEDSGVLDEELLPLLDEAISQEKAAKNFYVLHLMGGHGLYYNRYPYSFHRFTAQDIQLEVPERSRTVVAEYDNALYYNDYIVKTIIDRFRTQEAVVIYMPDHGEAVYDENNSMVGHIEENSNRHMIEIPLVVWASDSFKQKYPQKWQAICAATSRPYMSDDMIHTVMDLADVKTNEYDAARSIINQEFNAARPRIFNNMDYDKQILLDKKYADSD